MRHIVSGMQRQFLVRVPGKKPTVVGATEAVWPCRTILIPPREVFAVKDDDATVILELRGMEGIVEMLPGMDPSDTVIEAKSKRAGFLEGFINEFREENARRRAMDQGIMMPKRVHRDALKELKGLQEDLSQIDAELLGPATAPSFLRRETIEDVAMKELTAFGITPETAPLMPDKLPLMDVEGL